MVMQFTLILSLIFLLNASNASAEAGGCTTDVQKFCGDIQPGGGRIMKCLKDHRDQLSEECRTADEEKRTSFKKKLQECRADIKKHCAGVKKGKGRLQRCLRQKGKIALSPQCASALGL